MGVLDDYINISQLGARTAISATDIIHIRSTGNIDSKMTITDLFDGIPVSVNVGSASGAGILTSITSTQINIGAGRLSDGSALIDFTGDTTYADGLRIIRNSGANGETNFIHRGTGNVVMRMLEDASFLFRGASASYARFFIDKTEVYNDLYVTGNINPTTTPTEDATTPVFISGNSLLLTRGLYQSIRAKLIITSYGGKAQSAILQEKARDGSWIQIASVSGGANGTYYSDEYRNVETSGQEYRIVFSIVDGGPGTGNASIDYVKL